MLLSSPPFSSKAGSMVNDEYGVVVVLRLTVERRVGMERQDLSYGEDVHKRFTSSGPSRRK